MGEGNLRPLRAGALMKISARDMTEGYKRSYGMIYQTAYNVI